MVDPYTLAVKALNLRIEKLLGFLLQLSAKVRVGYTYQLLSPLAMSLPR